MEEEKKERVSENQRLMLQKFMEGRMQNQINFYSHPSYRLEQQLTYAISKGDLEQAKKTMDEINRLERAVLAKDPIRSLKNSLICTCTIITRAAIEGGLHPEDAFNLSDVYIRQVEETNDRRKLEQLEYDMLHSFIRRLNEGKRVSHHWVVNKALDIIHGHIIETISLRDLAGQIGVHPSYLSQVFRREMGIPLSEYIHRQKIEASQYFLLHSQSSISEIAVLFGFCNQSYYTSLFRKYVGITPKQYRIHYHSYT